MKTEIKTAIICGIIITVGIISISIFYNEVDMKRNTTYNIEIDDKSKLQKVPSIVDATDTLTYHLTNLLKLWKERLYYMIFGHIVALIVLEPFHTSQHGMKNMESRDW